MLDTPIMHSQGGWPPFPVSKRLLAQPAPSTHSEASLRDAIPYSVGSKRGKRYFVTAAWYALFIVILVSP